ncbi:hypothetical protein PM082_021639 [Marasmius tenuissimus]|nr:hypothetical protein PM082_021639 [Marasmius tenuissimus]
MRTDHFYGYIRPILSSPIPTSLPPLPPPSPPLSLPLVLHTSHAGSRIYKPPTFPWTTSIPTSVFMARPSSACNTRLFWKHAYMRFAQGPTAGQFVVRSICHDHKHDYRRRSRRCPVLVIWALPPLTAQRHTAYVYVPSGKICNVSTIHPVVFRSLFMFFFAMSPTIYVNIRNAAL